MDNQQNVSIPSQTVLLLIAVILALGVGFAIGYATGVVEGESRHMDMTSMMEGGMHEHMHSEIDAAAGGHDHAAPADTGAAGTSEPSVSGAMKMMQ